MTKNYAYITLLTDNTYWRGAVVLKESLKRVNAKYPFICYYTEEAKASVGFLSATYGVECRPIEPLIFSDEIYNKNKAINANLADLWRSQPTKFRFFSLTEFDKLVYLDADTAVLNNCDELFEYDQPCMGVIDDQYNEIKYTCPPFINAGMLFIKSDLTIFDNLCAELRSSDLLSAKRTFMEAGFLTEQDLLNTYFEFDTHPSLLLSKYYNIFAPYVKETQMDDVLENGKVIHYVGNKYWQKNVETGKYGCLEYGNKTLYEFAQTILLYCTQIHRPINWSSKEDLDALQQLQNKIAKDVFDDFAPRALFNPINKKLCVYAICKNESKFVSQWLDNMQEADYIVVLDTGSTDGTYEMLQADPRVTRVEQQVITPWRFDVARNESMKLIPDDADILVCTDFDELFTAGWAEEIKRAWRPDLGVNRVHYKFAWSHSAIGEPSDVFMYDKVHDRNFHWKFPVHEVLWPIDDTTKIIFAETSPEVMLHHYPDKTKSRKFYFDLLQLTCEENPDDCHPRMLLAREYLINSDYEKALENYLATLKMPDVDTPEKRLVLLESLGRCADCYKLLNNYDEAIWYCQEFIKEDPTYREPYFIMAEIYNEMKMYTLAEACAKAALEHGTRKNNWVERAPTWINWSDDILSVTYFNLKKYNYAVKHGREAIKHAPEDSRLKNNYIAYLEAYATQLEEKILASRKKNEK